MNWYKTLQFREYLLKESETNEHHRLRERLGEWAVSLEYPTEQCSLKSGLEPDVLRLKNASKLLFLGDAKCISSEPASRSATRDNLEKYFGEFAAALNSKQILGGTLAVATNSLEAAKAWVPALNEIAAAKALAGPNGDPPNFSIKELDPKTFIIFW